MIKGAVFMYNYHAYGNPYHDIDIVLLTMLELDYIKEVEHNAGAQSAYTVTVGLDEVCYPADDPVWRDVYGLTEEGSTINLAELDNKIESQFDEALNRCKPTYYLKRSFMYDDRLFTVVNVPTIASPFFKAKCESYYIDLTTSEFYEAIYGEDYTHKRERGL